MYDKMLSVAEACTVLNVSETTLKRWAREHLLKSVKDGNSLLFPEGDVLKYKEINDRLRK